MASRSAGEKLARFLLEFSAEHGDGEAEVRVTLTLASVIGTSRETVRRLLADFKKNQRSQVKGSTLFIKEKAGLENV